MKKFFSFIFISSLILSSANSMCCDPEDPSSSSEEDLFKSIELLEKPTKSNIENYISRFDQIFIKALTDENLNTESAIERAQNFLEDLEQENINNVINMLKKYGYTAKINQEDKLEISISFYQLIKKLTKNKLTRAPKEIKTFMKNNYGKIMVPVTLASAVALYLKYKDNPSEILPVINENINNFWELLGDKWGNLVNFWQKNKYELFPKEI